MSDIIPIKTISSIELCDLINKIRKEEGIQKEIRHDSLLAKIEDELEGVAQNFLGNYKTANNRTCKCYNLPQKEALQVIASESKKVRRRLIDEIERLTTENNQLKQSIASYMIQDPIERAKKWIEEQEEHRRIEQEQQKTIDNYKLATEKKIEKQKLFSEINRLIRKKAFDNFDGVFEDSYRYYYKELANRHNFIHKVDMTFLKQHKEYAQELLEMLL